MQFIQIVELRTNRVDEMTALEREWEQATEGKRTLRRAVVARDRNNPDRHFVLAFFDDYDSAMVNSALPETQQLVEKQAALLDGPPSFIDLDVIEDRS